MRSLLQERVGDRAQHHGLRNDESFLLDFIHLFVTTTICLIEWFDRGMKVRLVD